MTGFWSCYLDNSLLGGLVMRIILVALEEVFNALHGT